MSPGKIYPLGFHRQIFPLWASAVPGLGWVTGAEIEGTPPGWDIPWDGREGPGGMV